MPPFWVPVADLAMWIERIYGVAGDVVMREVFMAICRQPSEFRRRILDPDPEREPRYVTNRDAELDIDYRTGRVFAVPKSDPLEEDFEGFVVEVSRQSLHEFVTARLRWWKKREAAGEAETKAPGQPIARTGAMPSTPSDEVASPQEDQGVVRREPSRRAVGRPAAHGISIEIFNQRRQAGVRLPKKQIDEAQAIIDQWPAGDPPRLKTVVGHISSVWRAACKSGDKL